jgi:hypothetical protein
MGSDVVQSVLDEFFTLSDEGYKNHRADLEIREYHAFIDKQRSNGKLGGRPKKTQRKPTANPTQTQKKPNQQPLTTNQQPIKSATEVAVCLPDWMPMETWDAFIAMRKKIKKPATDYAIKLLVGKLTKFKESGQDVQKVLEKSITAGWQDVFEIHEKQQFNKFDVSHVTTPPPPNQDAALRKIEEDRKNSKPPSLEVLAKMAELRKSMA